MGEEKIIGRQTCAFCKGSGKRNGWKCDVCGGSGKVPVYEKKAPDPSDTSPESEPKSGGKKERRDLFKARKV